MIDEERPGERPMYIAIALKMRLTAHLTLSEHGALMFVLGEHWEGEGTSDGRSRARPHGRVQLAEMAQARAARHACFRDVLRFAVHDHPGQEHGDALQ